MTEFCLCLGSSEFSMAWLKYQPNYQSVSENPSDSKCVTRYLTCVHLVLSNSSVLLLDG